MTMKGYMKPRTKEIGVLPDETKDTRDAHFYRLRKQALKEASNRRRSTQPTTLAKKKHEKGKGAEGAQRQIQSNPAKSKTDRLIAGNKSPKLNIYERSLDAKRKRDAKIESMRTKLSEQCSFTPTTARSSSASHELSVSASVFDRLYQQPTSTSRQRKVNTHEKPCPRSFVASSIKTGKSSIFDKLYEDALRRQNERKQREQNIKEEPEHHPKTYWGSMLKEAETLAESVVKNPGRLGIKKRTMSTPFQSPPREILISPPLQFRGASIKRQFPNNAPWQSPPRPIRRLPPPRVLDPIIALYEPIKKNLKFSSRFSSGSTWGSHDARSDGETSGEDDTSQAGAQDDTSQAEKTEYGSI